MAETTAISQTQETIPATRREVTLIPPVDVFEDENGLNLYADLPGVAPDQLDVRVDQNTLTIEGKAVIPTPEGMEALYAEVRSPHYRRSFTLSSELEAEKIEAKLKDGVLHLYIPKRESARPRKIQVKVA
ncbi:MAG TPA: Hsp20/alpha crystallin family protein [Methylothermaceae bacterium]|nr:Hsp20/alpha crystallin family protein [Methylothermaceae bacterium]